jgi:hypothetical protein
MRLNKYLLGLALAVSASAMATVTFNPAASTPPIGFVGKGDVQLAFAWNNADLQKKAGGVSFRFVDVRTYRAVCQWLTGNPDQPQSIHSHDKTITTTAGVNAAVQYDARVRNQITGFTLLAFSGATSSDEVPVVGGVCRGDPDNQGNEPVGQWISVELVEGDTPTVATLYVLYTGAPSDLGPIAIWTTPPVVLP